MQKKRRLRIDRIIIAISILIAIPLVIFGIIRDMKLKDTIEYKLGEVGYQEEDVLTILNNTNENQLNIILNKEYNESIPKLLTEKYFIFDSLDRYLAFINTNKEIKLNEVISRVNANADNEFYTNIKKADTSKDLLILVNKFNQLEEDYSPEDLVACSPIYAYDNNKLREEAYIAFKQLFNAAKKEGYTIIINSSYRDYKWQEKLYNSYRNQSGLKYADSIAARAGHSEHQTGLAIDVATYNTPLAKFEDTEAFTWMKANAHKYGFILRYPKDKEHIAGYQYEPWHYRYVGVEIANKIYNENITYEK